MTKNLAKQNHLFHALKNALLVGFCTSTFCILIWFLLSQNARSIGIAILLTCFILFSLLFLLIKYLRSAKKGIRIIVYIASFLITLCVFICVTVYFLAPTQLFYPHFDEEAYQTLQTIPQAEELSIQTPNGNISGWFYHNEATAPAPLILYYYGNGENAATRMNKIINEGYLPLFDGYNIAIFDFPGYGKTEGSPSETSLKQFSLDAYDAIASRDDVDSEQIVLFGYSLGTGISNYVAANRSINGMALMAPYADGYDIFNNFIPMFYGPFRSLVAFKMESISYAPKISVCPLILATKDDEMVPFQSSSRLSKAYSECIFTPLEGFGHNEFWGTKEVQQALSDYFAECLLPEGGLANE